jgi:GNAT superfamily N-acetyltransferase
MAVRELPVFQGDTWFTWESQAEQYPPTGQPGVSYFRGDMSDGFGPGAHIDCLLFRDASGVLVGILNHYPMDFPPYEQAGNVLVIVREDRQRRGIGTRLVREAMTRWPVDPYAQRYTQPGADFVRALMTRG